MLIHSVKLLNQIQKSKRLKQNKTLNLVSYSLHLCDYFIIFSLTFITKHIAYKLDNDFRLWTIPWCIPHDKNVCISIWLLIHSIGIQCSILGMIRLSFWFLYDQVFRSVLCWDLSILFLFSNQVRSVAKK